MVLNCETKVIVIHIAPPHIVAHYHLPTVTIQPHHLTAATYSTLQHLITATQTLILIERIKHCDSREIL
jgi:hypothetical protein